MLFKLLLFIYVNNINAFNYYNAFNRRTMLKTTSGILFSNNINLNENYIDEIDDNIIDNKNNKKNYIEMTYILQVI